MAHPVQIPERPHPDPLPEGEGERVLRPPTLILVAKWIICAVVVAYVAYALAQHIGKIDWSTVHLNLPLALAAGVCIVLVTLAQIVAYRFLLAAYGAAPSWPHAATLSWVPALGKYVPGKIAAIGGTVYLLRRFRISAPVALSVALMGDALAVLTGIIVAAPMLRLPEMRARLPGGWIWSLAIILIGLICLWPPVFSALVNLALRRLKRPTLGAIPHFLYYIAPVLATASQWIFWGFAVWFTARSIGCDVALAEVPAMIFMIALANTIGYLAIFAPGGIGVREGILLAALTPMIGNTAAIVVLALRLIQTIVEIALALAGIWILKRNPMPAEAGTPI
jgi:uncharacterized membrane protein YbhN (UPF0104 family)